MEASRRRGRQAGLVLFGLVSAWFFLFVSSDAVLASPSPVTATRTLLDVQQSESRSGLSLLLMVSVLSVSFLCAYLLRDFGVTMVHESGVAVVLGMAVGLAVKNIRTVEELHSLVLFDQTSFFLFLLPPIIFASGYSMKRRMFFKNLSSILAFAFGGTVVNAFVFAGLLFAIQLAVPFAVYMSFLDCLIFGSIISATDPVTVLAIFSQLHVDFNLYANVFGESVLNDAVAIVLYRTVSSFLLRSVSVGSLFLAGGEFVVIFGASTLIGAAAGLWSALLFKWTRLFNHVILEGALIMLIAYSSYLLADGIALSGIVAVLFCGIVMAHYTFNNLSAKAREFTREMFECLSSIAETFVFAYLGMAVFSFRQQWDVKLILISLFVMLVARAVNVFPIAFLINVSRKSNKIPFRHQLMLWFAGLRGAMAFALVLNVPVASGTLMLTTTLVLCIFTVLVFGGLSAKALQLLDIDMHLDPRLASDDDDGSRNSFFLRIDRAYLKPFFTRLRPRTRVDEQPNEADLDEFELVSWRAQEEGGKKRREGDESTESTEGGGETSAAVSSMDDEQSSTPTAVFDSTSRSE